MKIMRWVVLAILVALLLWPLRSSAPNPNDAAVDAAAALGAEFAEPYRVLAAQLPAPDSAARQHLEDLSGALFRVENVQLTPLEKSSGQWRAQLEADIVCALPTDSHDLSLREAAAFAMAYRTVCAVPDSRSLRHVTRKVIFAKRDGRWVAQLSPPEETNP